jgi:hypothetical protein
MPIVGGGSAFLIELPESKRDKEFHTIPIGVGSAV